MDFGPIIFLLPLFEFFVVIWRMRGKNEFGARSLSEMADGAAESLARMRAVRTGEQLGVRVRLKRFAVRAGSQLGIPDGLVVERWTTFLGYRIDSLVTGGAAIEPWHSLETVVNR